MHRLAGVALVAPAGATIEDVSFQNGTSVCRLVAVVPSRQRAVDLYPTRSVVFRNVGGNQVELTAQTGGKITREGACLRYGGTGANVTIGVRKRR